MTEKKRILIGEIATAHGIKGFVKLRSFVDDEELFKGQQVFVSENGNKTIKIMLKSRIKNDWLAEVEGVSDRNAAELLRATKLYVDRDSLPETDGDDGYYIEDLKGLRVVDKDGKEIGIVLSIENFGASDLIDIKPEVGSSFYIPFTDDTVIEVDVEGGKIIVEMPETM